MEYQPDTVHLLPTSGLLLDNEKKIMEFSVYVLIGCFLITHNTTRHSSEMSNAVSIKADEAWKRANDNLHWQTRAHPNTYGKICSHRNNTSK